MTEEMVKARSAVEELWGLLEEGPRQALVNAMARAVTAGATVRDLQEWLDSCLYGTE
ncbi:MAG TPA: hypothetical protein VEB64_01400 [Azospirillaceae bacterium]|nr:hypothetical protein [Azospirillaceae bacterium]